MSPRFRIYRDRKGGWRFRLLARNGEVVYQGESYTRRRDCVRAIRRFQALTAEAKIA